jgi:hypothetical protein
MAYFAPKESLVPLLARCIIKHGTIKAIRDYPSTVSDRGGDATVTDEFIALNEIRRYEDSNEMIQAAFENALSACMAALDKAGQENKELSNRPQNNVKQKQPVNPFFPYWKHILLWCGVIGIGAWMDEENFSATLAASVVIAGTGLLCFLAFLSKESQCINKP